MTKRKWWKTAIGYEIYPQSFYDSNGDGWGDLKGIISKLDYLVELGVNLLWICPFFESPMDDNGYDVSHHYLVDPRFGTNEDLETLIEEAHARDIKIIIDFVLNHTSDEHPWFKRAISSPQAKEHDYYIFQKPSGLSPEGLALPPNNWRGFFSDSAWAYLPKNDEFYMKIFSRKMPDLNWENKELREQIYRIARYYLDLGIDGFRIDAIAHLARDLTFENSTLPVDPDGLVLDMDKFSNRDRLFDYLAEFKEEVLSHYPEALTIGEVGGGSSTAKALRYSGYEQGLINMVFNFDTCWENGAYDSYHLPDEMIRTNVVNMKRIFKRWYDDCYAHADMPLYWVNHDHPRVLSQYGSILYRNESAKMLITVLLFMYGTPFIYNGDEIGMSNIVDDDLTPFYTDVSTRNFIEYARQEGKDEAMILRFLKRTARVNARTPMQWNDEVNAGFSSGTPVVPVNSNYREVNVEANLQDGNSIFRYYQKAIRLRQEEAISSLIIDGPFAIIDIDHPDVFAYTHTLNKTKLLVIANFRDYQVEFHSSLLLTKEKILLHNYDDELFEGRKVTLRPFECYLILGK